MNFAVSFYGGPLDGINQPYPEVPPTALRLGVEWIPFSRVVADGLDVACPIPIPPRGVTPTHFYVIDHAHASGNQMTVHYTYAGQEAPA